MEDSGNALFYAALIVIAFISWVVGKIREAMAAFRERQDYKNQPVRTDIGPPKASRPPPPSPPAPQISQRDRAKEAMRETYRALGIPFPDDEPPAPASTQPPPRPVRTASQANATKKIAPAGKDQLTDEERKALNRLQQRRNANAASNSDRDEDGSSSSSTAGARTLRRLLRNRKATRQAILLKEILDSPKSLQSDSL